jgi:L-lactate dehydrogenase complex protein LldG
MLTRKHIVVVDADTIVSRPSEVFSESCLDGKGLSRSFSFITGPSATADMGPLVRGVHGPGKLHIIIVG